MRLLWFALLVFWVVPGARPQSVSAHAVDSDVPALLVSDVHFDPFHDPGRVKQLAAAPVGEWRRILESPASAGQVQAFDALQQKCHARGVDTPYVLFESSLHAMKAEQPDAKFMIVSGDLIAHAFTCRYEALLPGAPAGSYEAFVTKTLDFVVQELRAAFPAMPVYAALGNNDSGCGDYQLDTGSSFLSVAGTAIVAGLPESERSAALKEFADGGYYSVRMAAPMRNTRLIVVNDLFLSPKYSTCSGRRSTAGADRQMVWLRSQLDQARRSGERVWMVGHIPPGIDPYSTIRKFTNVCAGDEPVLFLFSDKMADLMVEYADVVRLGIFAHTHMDELRLLSRKGSTQHVAIKMISSISPVDGNNPSFTVARVNSSAARMDDYKVIAASNQTGVGTKWTVEYDYGRTYHQAEFSAAAVESLIGKFKADQSASTAVSQAYLRDYFVGDRSMLLAPFWPQYVCALGNDTAKGYAACVCGAGQ